MQQIALTLTKILHHKVGDQDALLIDRNLAWARTSALGRTKESLHTEIIPLSTYYTLSVSEL